MKIIATLAFFYAAPLGSAQEPDWNRNLAAHADVSAPTTITNPVGCSTTDCHPGIKEHSFLHGPLHINACVSCHSLSDAKSHSFEFVLPSQELCLSCHEIPDASEGYHIHEPLLKGECLGCHDAHGSEQPRAILSTDRSQICSSCHFELTSGEAIVHAAEDEGSCTTCHKSHFSAEAKLLIQPSRSLCIDCHAKTAEELTTSFFTHPPALEDCRLCHDPHATGEKSMLIDDTLRLCASCHQDVGHEMDAASHPHGAMTAENSCLNCHEPHASNHGKLLRGPTSELCNQCHDKDIEKANGGLIPSMASAFTGRDMVHSPVERGECTLCHQVHGNSRQRLLKSEHSETYSQFQGAGDYGLCFSCHDKNLVLSETTNAVTDFRNGDVNLHYTHVNRPKSRSCNICHDPHAADAGHMLRQSFPFGPARWELKIDWQAIADGGSCAAGCHAPFEYNRLNPVDYSLQKQADPSKK